MNLTSRQFEVLDYIKKFIATKGYSPSVREIASALGYKSASSAQTHLRRLISAGVITIDKNKSRTIELLVQNEYATSNETVTSVPLLNDEDNSIIREFLEVPTFMLNDYASKNLYAYKKDKDIYIINAGLKLKDRPSLVEVKGKFVIDNFASEDIFGNIVSKFTIY